MIRTITEEFDDKGKLTKRTVVEQEAYTDVTPVVKNANPVDRVKRAAEYVSNCPCNPARGGSGICGCVNPNNVVYSVAQ